MAIKFCNDCKFSRVDDQLKRWDNLVLCVHPDRYFEFANTERWRGTCASKGRHWVAINEEIAKRYIPWYKKLPTIKINWK